MIRIDPIKRAIAQAVFRVEASWVRLAISKRSRGDSRRSRASVWSKLILPARFDSGKIGADPCVLEKRLFK